jgi:hypothetical protein
LDVKIPEEVLKMRVVVTFDMLTGELAVDGCDKNPIVALGMLDYALARVRRYLVATDMIRKAQNAPRIQVANRLVE